MPPPDEEWSSSRVPTALRDVLAALLALPGAEYACVLGYDDGFLAEVGARTSGASHPEVLRRWASEARAAAGLQPGDDVDDMTITSHGHFHVARWVAVPSQPERPLLVYLRLGRPRGNLAVARRELSTARLQAQLTAALGGSTDEHLDFVAERSPSDASAEPAVPTGRAVQPVLMHALPQRVPAATPLPTPSTTSAGSDEAIVETPPVLRQEWSADLDTLDRLLAGLRAMA